MRGCIHVWLWLYVWVCGCMWLRACGELYVAMRDCVTVWLCVCFYMRVAVCVVWLYVAVCV